MSHKHHHHEPQKEKAPEAKEQPTPTIPIDETAAKLRAELEQSKDRELRLQAELDNYRKRASRELEDRMKYADMDILRELLPVLDNIQRAVEHAGNSSSAR
jgi:molecular chaperone GrpE